MSTQLDSYTQIQLRYNTECNNVGEELAENDGVPTKNSLKNTKNTFFFIFGCWLLPEKKLAFARKNDGLTRGPLDTPARTPTAVTLRFRTQTSKLGGIRCKDA